MIDVFKKHAPQYKRLVRKFALDIWRNRENKKEFYRKAEQFKNKYERDLVKHYESSGINVYRGTIREKANQWMRDQEALVESLESIAQAKKNKLTAELFEELKKDKSAEAQKLLNKIYLSKEDFESGSEIYRIFSFSDNFEDKAEQIGEQSAFELGADINNEVFKEQGDGYDWQTQEDRKVRTTHRMLNKKSFLWSSPPTTIDEDGRRHTGPPGTDWGCRCYADKQRKKALLNYVADARKNEK